MIEKMKNILNGEYENHLMPFFWQHGEDEATLREYMKVICDSGCRAVCIESRPHPDFCGEKWWQDMDVILDEARSRGMQVWILDDSHFPTGFANGALKSAPAELHRQSICVSRMEVCQETDRTELDVSGMFPPEFHPNQMEQYVLPAILGDAPHFEDDRVIAVTAVNQETGERVYLDIPKSGEKLVWTKREGKWTLWVTGLSRNFGPHREYINMLDEASCRLLIDAVYEPHWEHYRDDFGKTIAGFFSDEPELGNGHIFCNEARLGTDQDLPFSRTLPEELRKRLGEDWANRMYLLWDNESDTEETAHVRYAYMDAVTKRVREAFSRQIGMWCREHGVQYIGHIIEDGNAHARCGVSLGHYFRGLDGQDMAGIDDIGGQVYPQGEDEPCTGTLGMPRDGEFYHYMLGSLAASAAAIEPDKHGNSMCEIFGNYGWAEGVQLEKYLADHFMVRGINHFVPHAFSPAPFPDPDCPPHFYAHGHNPQYRHFGALMGYMNRVSECISGGHRVVSAAILYHGEAEWSGQAMLSQKPARKLAEAQITYDCIPADVFAEREHYRTKPGNPLRVNTQEYRVLIVPYAQFITAEFAAAVAEIKETGFPVIFVGGLPEGICNLKENTKEEAYITAETLLKGIRECQVLSLEELVPYLRGLGLLEAVFAPENSYLRAMHYQGTCELYYFVNEAAQRYEGTVRVPGFGPCYGYDAWENQTFPVEAKISDAYLEIPVVLEPGKSLIVVLDTADEDLLCDPIRTKGEPQLLSEWRRRVCSGMEYPCFGAAKTVTLPDDLAKEQPSFSGFVRYESTFTMKQPGKAVLEVTDAKEGLEVFVNGKSAGIQIVPPYRYDLTDLAVSGVNELVIEAATTLERQCYDLTKNDPRMKMRGLAEPKGGSGITGEVYLYNFSFV